MLSSVCEFFSFGNNTSLHCLELFLDFTFMRQQFYPWVQQNKNDIKFLVRLHVQPWHPSSTLLHEAALAVSKLKGNQTMRFVAELFEHQEEYFDTALASESRLKTYERLSVLAKNTVDINPQEFLDLLYIESSKIGEKGTNVGNKVTSDLKLQIKYSRSKSVHVSPTVFFNGVINDLISSSWTLDNFKEWYEKNVNVENWQQSK
ncbi:hypothetical protein PORY_000486 [Pneumocystis oryctolagi]|uniref:Uncharacterized protein n=1 Tax=Pneumocystis oryctolagi TaxID=42067 RepID=A0ACB7CH12_9ASCO|nr:hypothetical protein PORY_000486 [Pneumocystis oryctolagi]